MEIPKQVNMTKLHKIKKFCAKILATIITAFFFLSCTFWIDTDVDGLLFIALFYCPWILFLFCYYTYILWSKKNVTGERLLLLPVLQKLHLLKDYSSNFDKKKQLLKTTLPVLIASIICPFIATLISDSQHDDDNFMLSFFLLIIAPILIIVNLVKAYSQKWLYSQEHNNTNK